MGGLHCDPRCVELEVNRKPQTQAFSTKFDDELYEFRSDLAVPFTLTFERWAALIYAPKRMATFSGSNDAAFVSREPIMELPLTE